MIQKEITFVNRNLMFIVKNFMLCEIVIPLPVCVPG